MTMRIFFTSSLMKVTSALSDRSVDWITMTEHITSGHLYACINESNDQKQLKWKNTQGEKYFKCRKLVLAQKKWRKRSLWRHHLPPEEPFQFIRELTEVSWGNEAETGTFPGSLWTAQWSDGVRSWDPSARGKTFSGELLWMISLMRSSIWAVAWRVGNTNQQWIPL